jgi:hypothetical protein
MFSGTSWVSLDFNFRHYFFLQHQFTFIFHGLEHEEEKEEEAQDHKRDG